MAFTEQFLDNSLKRRYYFIADYFGDDGANLLEEANSPDNRKWSLDTVKIHTSTAITSVTDFVVRVSSALGSHHDLRLVSQAMLSVWDGLFQFDPPIMLLSDDSIIVSMPIAISQNNAGILLEGWSVVEAP